MVDDPDITFDPAAFKLLYQTEDRHFWFRARNDAIATVMRSVTATLPSGYRLLEVGCGNGNVTRALEQAGPTGDITAMDTFDEGLAYARQRVRRARIVRGDILRDDPAPAPRYDVIGMFDVLEHLDDDLGVLRRLHSMIVPGGALVLTVPCDMALWSDFDRISHHKRRYEATNLAEAIEASGFAVEYLTPFMSTLYPLMWLTRRRWRKSAHAAISPEQAAKLAARELRIIPGVNEVLYATARQESRVLARRRRLPFGTSLIAVGRVR